MTAPDSENVDERTLLQTVLCAGLIAWVVQVLLISCLAILGLLLAGCVLDLVIY